MNEGQREQWRKALAAKAATQRQQRYRSQPRGIRSVRGVGMVRILPRKQPRIRNGDPDGDHDDGDHDDDGPWHD